MKARRLVICLDACIQLFCQVTSVDSDGGDTINLADGLRMHECVSHWCRAA